jgi:hypothetical protein
MLSLVSWSSGLSRAYSCHLQTFVPDVAPFIWQKHLRAARTTQEGEIVIKETSPPEESSCTPAMILKVSKARVMLGWSWRRCLLEVRVWVRLWLYWVLFGTGRK